MESIQKQEAFDESIQDRITSKFTQKFIESFSSKLSYRTLVLKDRETNFWRISRVLALEKGQISTVGP